jgi:hypothetical protein
MNRPSLVLLLLLPTLAGCGANAVPGETASSDGGSGPSGSNGTGACTGGSATNNALVYVSTGTPGGGNYHIEGFAAASDGSLTPVPGSPFAVAAHDPLYTAGTGSILFSADGYTISSFAVDPDGCLNLESSFIAGGGSPGNPSSLPLDLFLDPQHANLYGLDFVPADESHYTAYSFNAGGQLTTINSTQTDALNGDMLGFTSSDGYAVTSNCYLNAGPHIAVFQRAANGGLVPSGGAPWLFPTPPPQQFYCPGGAAGDNSGHIVIAVNPQPSDSPFSGQSGGPSQLAVYTVDSSGEGATTSTWQNMPVVSVGAVAWYSFSPDDKYLAVSGFSGQIADGSGGGVEIFTWDSKSGTLNALAILVAPETTCSIDNCSGLKNIAWDANDHLYALAGDNLFVYSVSSSGVTPAPGSPYPVQNPHWITVMPAPQ